MKNLTERKQLKATYALQQELKKNPRTYFEIENKIWYLIRQIKAMLMRGIDGPSLANAMHNLVDDAVKKAVKESKPICKRGCSFCCYQKVDISVDEAKLLIKCATFKKLPIDWDKVEKQAAAKSWNDLAYEDRSCVFLANNECNVYEYRPTSCRKYLIASGTPDQCDSQKNPGGDVKVLAANYAEIVASAMFTLEEGESIPKKLLEARYEET